MGQSPSGDTCNTDGEDVPLLNGPTEYGIPHRTKPGGVVVDYIGIGSELKQAARKYTAQGYGEPTEELEDAARKTK